MVQPSTRASATTVVQLLEGALVARAPHVVAELGVADVLGDGAETAEQLAAAVGAHPAALYRVLRALASVGIFMEHDDRRFALTSAGRCLRGDAPGSLRAAVLLKGSEEYRRTYDGLAEAVRTGASAFERACGAPFFAYTETHPAFASAFDRAMTSVSSLEIPAILDAYDFAGVGTVMDVGGGQGSLLAALLTRWSHLRGVLYDLPAVIVGARQAIGDTELSARCELVGGDFFAAVPAGAEVYLLKNVIHDWDDGQAVQILRNCRAGMQQDGRVLVIERFIPAGNVPSPNRVYDLVALALSGAEEGRERTEAEFRQLFAAAGFTLRRVIPTDSRVALLEAVAAPAAAAVEH